MEESVLASRMEEIRRENLIRLLLKLFEGDATRGELKTSLKVGTSTLSYLVAELREQGMVEERKRLYRVGRPSQVIGLQEGAWNVIGIKMGREGVSGVRFNARGQKVESFLRPILSHMRSNKGYTEALRDVLLYFKTHERGTPLLGIGVCSSGTVDSHRGEIVHSPVMNVEHLGVQQIATEIFGEIPILVTNDVDSLGAFEAFLNPRKDTLLISYGIGIGASYIHRGRVFHPVRGLSSFEIGHMVVANDGDCYCGQVGCLEYHASEYAILRRYQGLRESFRDFVEREEELFKDKLLELRKRARDPDHRLLRAYEEAFQYLALVVGNLVVLLKPARVVLFGEGIVGDWMADLLYKRITERFAPLMVGDFTLEVERRIRLWEEGAAFAALLKFLPAFVASRREKQRGSA